jgi:hypothetical protein
MHRLAQRIMRKQQIVDRVREVDCGADFDRKPCIGNLRRQAGTAVEQIARALCEADKTCA